MGLFSSKKNETKGIGRAKSDVSALISALDPEVASKRLKADHKLRKQELKQVSKADKKASKAISKSDKAHAKVAKATDKANVKIAKEQAKAAAEGKHITVNKAKRYLSVAKVVAPVLVPVAYRAATAGREQLNAMQANRAGVSIDELGKYSGHGAKLSARIARSNASLAKVAQANSGDAETSAFTDAMNRRLADLSNAVEAAEHMPASRRRTAHTAITRELDGIDADLLARLGVRP